MLQLAEQMGFGGRHYSSVLLMIFHQVSVPVEGQRDGAMA
jgi:hypothetical protein